MDGKHVRTTCAFLRQQSAAGKLIRLAAALDTFNKPELDVKHDMPPDSEKKGKPKIY